MAVIYLRSTDGDDADDGSTWALAKATLAAALTAAGAAGTVYVSKSHSELPGAAQTLTSPGAAGTPVKVLCVNDTGNPEPPTALATGAVVGTTGAYNVTFAGFAYYYGVEIRVGVSNGAARLLTFSMSSALWHRLEACQLTMATTGGGSIVIGGASGTGKDGLLELINTPISFGAVGHTINPYGVFVWKNTPTAILGSVPTTLLTPGAAMNGRMELDGVDLSALGSGKNLVSVAATANCLCELRNCKLGDSVSLVTGTNPGQGGSLVRLVNCDSADTNYRYQKSCYQGDIYSETTVVRTSGASDGTTAIARKMVSSAGSQFFSPLKSDPVVVWNETTGSSVTATVEVVTDNVTLTDAEAWIEVEYLGTSGVPLALFASDRAADIMATPANQTTSTATWTTTGLSTPVKQKLSVAFTPQEKGPVKIRVMLAKASTTMYFCPKADLT